MSLALGGYLSQSEVDWKRSTEIALIGIRQNNQTAYLFNEGKGVRKLFFTALAAFHGAPAGFSVSIVLGRDILTANFQEIAQSLKKKQAKPLTFSLRNLIL